MKWLKGLPNMMTLANLFLGALAIIFIIESSERLEVTNHLTQKFEITAQPIHFMYLGIAAYLIIAATVLDFLDGFVARLLNAQSELGGQLDSLADMVTFGLAPSLMMYKLMQHALASQSNGIGENTFVLWPALLIALGAAYRLAKFNIDTEQTTYFKGIPTPANALFIISIPFVIITDSFGTGTMLMNYNVLLGISLVSAYLMISNIPMLAFKFKSKDFASNKSKFLLLAIGLTSIIILGYLGVIVTFLSYILISILFKREVTQ